MDSKGKVPSGPTSPALSVRPSISGPTSSLPASPRSGIPAASVSQPVVSAVPPPPAAPAVTIKSDLPSFEPALTNIRPIPTKKLLMIVNTFVINTTEFINKFALMCERKLAKVNKGIQRVEIVLALLEAKLDSIKYLSGGVTQAAPSSSTPAPPTQGIPAAPSLGPATSAAPTPTATPSEGEKASAAPVAEVDQKHAQPKLTMKEDARYSMYFKILRLGVPKAQIKLKMKTEGVDPNIIDMDPEGPALPDAVSESESGGKKADSESDDDREHEEDVEGEGNAASSTKAPILQQPLPL